MAHMNIDIEAELSNFEWRRASWYADKLQAASPFRDDYRPSFYVYFRDTETAPAGSWQDSGAEDSAMQRGGIVKLLALLREEPKSDTLAYLKNKYGDSSDVPVDEDGRQLYQPIKLRKKDTEPFGLSESALQGVETPPVDYLTNRGISQEAQSLFGVGYDPRRKAAVFPWRGASGRLLNIMYRSTHDKLFWYAEQGVPFYKLLYGMEVACRRWWTYAVMVEAPIDALTLVSAGVPALALGNASFNRYKADLLARMPVQHITVIADNDKAGERWRRQAGTMLRGKVRKVNHVRLPREYKDVNEADAKVDVRELLN